LSRLQQESLPIAQKSLSDFWHDSGACLVHAFPFMELFCDFVSACFALGVPLSRCMGSQIGLDVAFGLDVAWPMFLCLNCFFFVPGPLT
jgi:hypothetical protein